MQFTSPNTGIFLEGPDTALDYFDADNVTYQALPLDESDHQRGRGVNATVFRARPSDDDAEELVLKICNFPSEWRGKFAWKRRNRFRREIRAMNLALRMGKADLVANIVKDFPLSIGDYHFRCFLMEKADGTLREYLTQEPDISLQQRLLLCWNLLQSAQALHDIGVYHRDIKPENVFNIAGSWKFGDLGLVAVRGEDEELDGETEKIGPLRWMSPEAVNKAFALQRSDNGFIDRTLDERSDNYQLGKLFWYVLQGDIPNGCMKSKDLIVAGSDVFGILLRPLLSYSRPERPTIKELLTNLAPLRKRYSF